VDRPEVRSIGARHLIMAGESVQGKPCKEGDVAGLVIKEIDRLADRHK